MIAPSLKTCRTATVAIVVLIALFSTQDFRAAAHEPFGPVEQFRARLTALRAQVDDIVDRNNLAVTLVFDWADRPYQRARLAILVKTVSVLERELALRGKGNGALSDEQTLAMLTWGECRVREGANFTTRFSTIPDGLQSVTDVRPKPPAPAFVFVDEVRVTPAHRAFGDMDLLAALGQKFYCYRPSSWMDTPELTIAQISKDEDQTFDDPRTALPQAPPQLAKTAPDRVRSQRVEALGMLEVRLQSHQTLTPGQGKEKSGHTLNVIECDLRDLLTGEMSDSKTQIALRDSAVEPRSAAIARRALLRGAINAPAFNISQWRSMCGDDAIMVRAAMWLDALEGIQLGLLGGWRDLRDGQPSYRPSCLIAPQFLETVAHTALEIQHLSSVVRDFAALSPLAIQIGLDAIDDGEPNEWAGWILPLFEELSRRQISYDLLPAEKSLKRSYATTIKVSSAHPPDLTVFGLQVERALARNHEASSPRVRLTDGSRPHDLYVRYATSGNITRVAIINLSITAKIVRLEIAERKNLKDMIADSPASIPSDAIPLAPWQVRILSW